MAVMGTETQPATQAPARRRPWLALLVAALGTAPYAVGLLLPYYANGLQDRPAGTSLYLYDLAGLWPYDTVLGGVITFGMLVGMPLAPFVSAGVAMWSGFSLWDARRTLPGTGVATYVLAVLLAIGSIAWLATPLATELVAWFLD
ncbi:hypothetical protein F4692_001121 [Nocardioides cavernae]|uniref:Uncharacterized protein n=1 Tax=Nocardioides cavernae TaxID=1921566 RepID=A0A7Y9H155_9ACTN|nr:hypothetical protein [Nocardioides cavernae]NYE36017.1 hypothetical protein [Nocardioides cavernae]